MVRLFQTKDPLLIARLQHVMESEGIACVIHAPPLVPAKGMSEADHYGDELLVLDDGQASRARELLERLLADDSAPIRHTAWICSRCGERIEPQFDACWRCQASHTTDLDPGDADRTDEITSTDEPSGPTTIQLNPWVVIVLLALGVWWILR